ncbi:YozE SAM-like fold [Mucilaginibacter gossypiicola]|uniref:YozE SAM-like fold n=1 Tax=Mucilaginibacter gossypiicola TaxID=551995 RepID=A0A1H8DC37_9SPHI|nr:sterile alpha motif-like domain-containing protein [Mucilaginibacter gossypiicola]SEN04128.1 YozE SAM-like fold [Mucilaginibacter gossypiicola]
MEHITKLCADSLRAFCLNKFGIQLKSSHAHELVAAYFGYSSRAALLADTKCSIGNLKDAEFIVLTPTALIRERRSKLNGLPQDLPEDLAEGVYLPLYDEKLILHSIWPTLEELGKALADQYLKSKPTYFRDQKIQKHGVKLEFENDELAIVVFREYISPNLLLSFQQGKRGVVDVFNMKRVAGHIGYVKTNHHSVEAETLDEAVVKMRDAYHQMISNAQSLDDVQPIEQRETNFTEWLTKQKNRDTPLGDLARDMMDDKTWPNHSTLDDYRDYLYSRRASWQAIETLERAWKTYKAFIKRKSVIIPKEQAAKRSSPNKPATRATVSVKKAIPLHFNKRTIEKFNPGDPAWISWDGKKAIPVNVVGVDERHYTVTIESPRKKAGNRHSLFLDEVRSSPELACANLVTL